MDKATRTRLMRLLVSKSSHNGHVDDWTLEKHLTQMEMLLVSLGFARPEHVWPDDEHEGRQERR